MTWPRPSRRALGGLAGALAALALVPLVARLAATDPVPGTFESALAWPAGPGQAGGFSGLLVEGGGRDVLVLSDLGRLHPARATRDPSGRLLSLDPEAPREVRPPEGADWPDTWFYDDSEGLARMPDGRLAVSFEGLHRITLHDADGRFSDWIDTPAMVAELAVNTGLEAVAVTPEGTLLALPEAWTRDRGRVPVLAVTPPEDTWRIVAWLPTAEGYAPVGLDIDREGRLYLLERRLVWWRGFSTRIRRIRLEGFAVMEDRVLLQTAFGRHGNLEGISVWHDAAGTLRASLVSDNNTLRFLRQEIVEYRLND